MYVIFDYQCPNCGEVDERTVRRDGPEKQFCQQRCPQGMKQLPAGTRTHFRFADKKLKP